MKKKKKKKKKKGDSLCLTGGERGKQLHSVCKNKKLEPH